MLNGLYVANPKSRQNKFDKAATAKTFESRVLLGQALARLDQNLSSSSAMSALWRVIDVAEFLVDQLGSCDCPDDASTINQRADQLQNIVWEMRATAALMSDAPNN